MFLIGLAQSFCIMFTCMVDICIQCRGDSSDMLKRSRLQEYCRIVHKEYVLNLLLNQLESLFLSHELGKLNFPYVFSVQRQFVPQLKIFVASRHRV